MCCYAPLASRTTSRSRAGPKVSTPYVLEWERIARSLLTRIQREVISRPSDAAMFDAPQNVTLQELKIESYFPLDDQTAFACEQL